MQKQYAMTESPLISETTGSRTSVTPFSLRTAPSDISHSANIFPMYFQHTAISLTTDVSKYEEWHGGDIVVFKNHIGIVSDRRNANGTPFVIHHGSPTQIGYEQDILEGRDDIIGHFRVS